MPIGNEGMLVGAQGTAASGTADDGSSPVKVGGIYLTADPTYTNGQRGNARVTVIGDLRTTLVNSVGSIIAAGDVTNADGRSADGNQTRLQTVSYNLNFNGTAWDRAKKPNLTSRIPSAAASTNATVAKAGAGEVHNIIAINTTAALKYLKLYNKATAPTVGTDTPVLTIALAPSNALTHIPIANGGEYFSAGIAYALTGAAADADATALAAGDVVGLNIVYS